MAAAPVIVLALGAVVVALIPDVNGTFDAAEAPTNATAWLVAVGMGAAVELAGLSTLLSNISSFLAKGILRKLTYQ
jgi:hypothetical protein